VYLPDLAKQAYQDLLDSLADEFTHAFGGCTVNRRLQGHYLTRRGRRVSDPINLIYLDTPFDLEGNRSRVALYAERLRQAVFDALEEETVLIAVLAAHHAE